MSLLKRSLGFRLAMVTSAIVAVAIIVVGVVVGKLSEDDVKARLLSQARDLATMVDAGLGPAPTPEELDRAVLQAKVLKTGSAWVLDREGRFVASSDPRRRRDVQEGTPFGATPIDLMAVSQPLAGRSAKGPASRVPLRAVLDQYEAGFGVLQTPGERSVVAFQALPARGWVVGVDEPSSSRDGAAASLKFYVGLACVILGLSILLSTVVSISFIIKPYYREKLELSARMEAANRNLKKLHEVSVGMQKSRSLEGRIQKILGAAHEVLGLDRIFIYLPNTENTVLECRGAFGNLDEPAEAIAVPVGPEGGVLAQAFLKRKTFQVNNAQELPRELRLQSPYSEIKALRSRSFVVLPMIVESSCVGVVAVDNLLSKLPITPEVIEGLELFTSQAAVSIENAKLFHQLKVYADELEVTDHLTQLFTFFHFKKLLQGEIDRARISGQSFCLAVASIESFARYNELLGHRFGDEVLRQVAAVIREAMRKKDVSGRCFGSTFAVLLPNTALEEGRRVLEGLVARLDAAHYPGVDTMPEGKIAFQSGLAEFRKGEGWSAEDFFNHVLMESKSAPA